MIKVGFIGCGNMGGALLKAVSLTERYEIYAADFCKEKVDALSKENGAKASSANEIAQVCDYIFIGVKPQMLEACYAEIKEILSERSGCIIVSMAAGVTVNKTSQLSGVKSVIRIMPNMPVSVGSGVVLGTTVNVDDISKSEFEQMMSKVGVFDWIEEKFIDAASAVSGCGPAFVYMFTEALADGAVACGLPRDKALLYASGMVKGSAETVLQSGKHPGKLKDEVCSPGGSTIMGVKALEDGAFRANVINAVIEAYKKTKELG